MNQSEDTKGITATDYSNGAMLQTPRPWSYPEGVHNSLRKNAHNEVIARANAALIRLKQPTNKTQLQCGDALFAKVIRVGDVYDEGKLNEKFIENVDESMRYTLRDWDSTHKKISPTWSSMRNHL